MERGTLLAIVVLCISVQQQTALDSFQDRVAVVTGASSGIGKAIAIELVKKGMRVVGIARRLEILQGIATSLQNESGTFIPRKCDVRVEEEVVSTFQWIGDTYGAIAVLVNSAGIAIEGGITNGSTSNWRDIIDTNVLGLSMCTREAVQNMIENDARDGQIIQLSSVLGYYFTNAPGGAFYSASKFAVTSLCESVKREMASMNYTIRVTCMMPGTVNTPLLTNPKFTIPPEAVAALPKIEPKDVADAMLYILSTPSNVQIVNLMIQPVGEQIINF